MSIESGDLVDLGHGQLHPVGQRGEMRGGKVAIGILNTVHVFDQQIAAQGIRTQKRLDITQGLRLYLSAFRGLAALAATGFPDALGIIKDETIPTFKSDSRMMDVAQFIVGKPFAPPD
jgi:hypothetical protein